MPTDLQRAWINSVLGVREATTTGGRTGPSPAKPKPARGKPSADNPEVRPSEMISGASGVQYSTGENSEETAAQGTDFAIGSRLDARTSSFIPEPNSEFFLSARERIHHRRSGP